MVVSNHSHSGQFCGHATDTLEEVIQEAISQKFKVFSLTEHMPRDAEADLYPEEVEEGTTNEKLVDIFDKYYAEARRLQIKYQDEIKILVGMEIDWIRPSSKQWIESLLDKYKLDLFVGSVHHVHGVPIDYNDELYNKARSVSSERDVELSARGEELLFADYFETQYEMLQALRPPIVGHFDLIRLKSTNPDGSLRIYSRVWRKVLRNLRFIVEYGGVLEINTAAWKKGLKEAYPNTEVANTFAQMGGEFTFSDDSHGVKHVGHSYSKLKPFMKDNVIWYLTFFEKKDDKETVDKRFVGLVKRRLAVDEFWDDPFWKENEKRQASFTLTKAGIINGSVDPTAEKATGNGV